jgi:hypothetical protein
MKLPYSFKLDEDLLSKMKLEAKSENRSFNNYVESLLITHPSRGGGVKNETLNKLNSNKKGKN